MIGVQYQLTICRGHIRASNVAFQFFVVDSSMEKMTFMSDFSLLSLFQLQFQRVINGLAGQKIISEVYLSPVIHILADFLITEMHFLLSYTIHNFWNFYRIP